MERLSFPARRCAILFEAVTPLALPPYKGSTFRGAFGHAFKGVACALRRQDCGGCLLRERCAYIQVFETPVREEDRARGVNTFAPHPFVLEPPPETRTEYPPGEALEGGLVLIGRAIDLLPYFIYALERMGERGLGRGRGRARLKAVLRNGITIYDGATGGLRETEGASSRLPGDDGIGERVTLHFLTPLRLKVRNRYTDSPTFADLVEHLAGRVEALARYHVPASNGLDGAAARAAAREARVVAADFRWVDWERYSARQEARMKLGGVVGTMEVAGVPEALRPWLRLGELVHVGKGTSFGLGRYLIR